jgi:hypothetical protein
MFDVDDLKRALQERANLNEEQATRAAQVVLDLIAERAPQLGGLMDKAGGAEGIARQLGGLFGRRE